MARRRGKAWGNALGGYKTQRRASNGQFGTGGGTKARNAFNPTKVGSTATLSPSASGSAASPRLTKAQRRYAGYQKHLARQEAARKKEQRKKVAKRSAIAAGAVTATAALYALDTRRKIGINEPFASPSVNSKPSGGKDNGYQPSLAKIVGIAGAASTAAKNLTRAKKIEAETKRRAQAQREKDLNQEGVWVPNDPVRKNRETSGNDGLMDSTKKFLKDNAKVGSPAPAATVSPGKPVGDPVGQPFSAKSNAITKSEPTPSHVRRQQEYENWEERLPSDKAGWARLRRDNRKEWAKFYRDNDYMRPTAYMTPSPPASSSARARLIGPTAVEHERANVRLASGVVESSPDSATAHYLAANKGKFASEERLMKLVAERLPAQSAQRSDHNDVPAVKKRTRREYEAAADRWAESLPKRRHKDVSLGDIRGAAGERRNRALARWTEMYDKGLIPQTRANRYVYKMAGDPDFQPPAAHRHSDRQPFVRVKDPFYDQLRDSARIASQQKKLRGAPSAYPSPAVARRTYPTTVLSPSTIQIVEESRLRVQRVNPNVFGASAGVQLQRPGRRPQGKRQRQQSRLRL